MKILDVEQKSFAWHRARAGKLTGTHVEGALGTLKAQETLRYKLVSELMTELQITELNTEAVKRGVEMEPMARLKVIAETGIDFVETGMLISDSLPRFGLSPDGICVENNHVVGGLEIKCPSSAKHLRYCDQGDIPKEYRGQIKAPFLISDDIQWWLFASYDDRNYSRPLFILKVSRDNYSELLGGDIEQDRESLRIFIESCEALNAKITF